MSCICHAPIYPQNVDGVKTTNCHLRTNAISADQEGMGLEAPYIEIGERLRVLRVGYSDMSQKDWAAKHGFSKTQYNNWESGVRRIPVESAERLCDTYGLTLDFVYRGRRDGLSENARNAV